MEKTKQTKTNSKNRHQNLAEKNAGQAPQAVFFHTEISACPANCFTKQKLKQRWAA